MFNVQLTYRYVCQYEKQNNWKYVTVFILVIRN